MRMDNLKFLGSNKSCYGKKIINWYYLNIITARIKIIKGISIAKSQYRNTMIFRDIFCQ
ncbi:hypothetical protein WP8S17E05_16000 [Escherichia coli]|nr:hypothetical protein WP8S17E05_16000 [Escherichia coli]GCR71877.1 hypothetical protein BvCmsHHNP002_04303 [Escherichia coli]GCR77874.1 hypothetical protein BvCmsHHNP004_00652 [Escherichia coli]CAJ1233560.1 hypothetical protein JRT77AECX_JRT77AEC_00064 [Escherichia coli]STD56847.1 Uncharacterised protein [Escherichia coli]